MIKHKYEPSVITPGLCGASELARGTQGHFICCGKPESHETHKARTVVQCADCREVFPVTDSHTCRQQVAANKRILKEKR